MQDRDLAIAPELAARCLFVIGPAKSGTTVLAEALNDAREIYLLNEPDLHRHEPTDGFALRFNAHYARWASQPTKARFCPDFFAGGGSWADSLTRLAASHRWVGAKIVTRPFPSSEQIEAIQHFHARHFFDSRYLFSFRAPAAIVVSSHYFQRAFGGESAPVADVVRNFADTVGLFIIMRRLFPNVSAVFHDDMGSATFEKLAQDLDVALPRAASYYDARRIIDHAPLAYSAEEAAAVAAGSDIYDELVAQVRDDMPRLQIGQTFLAPLAPEAAVATGPGRLAQLCHQLGNLLRRPGA